MAETVSINVADGFLPHFVPEFMARYGTDSLFVRSSSDVLTLRVARTMWNNGKLPRPDLVAVFGTESAADALEALLNRLPQTVMHLMWEAMGTQPIGKLAEVVDATLKVGSFTKWLAAFESEDFETATRLAAGAGAT